jgi:hypothetical protein
MYNTVHNGVNTQKLTPSNGTEIETDFGNRKISDQNFSKIIALPKTALMNCGNPVKVNVKLVQEADSKYIKLIPIQYKDLEEI